MTNDTHTPPKSEPDLELRTRTRPTDELAVKIPVDTLVALKRVAEQRDMSPLALINFYIGQGLRQDLSRLFAENVLAVTAEVLAQHGAAEEEISRIMAEVRAKFAR